MRRAAGLVSAALLLLATPAVTIAQAETLAPADAGPVLPAAPDGSLRHVPSGYAFPARLGDLPVGRKQVYALDDVMVQYADAPGAAGTDGKPWLDLIVYRARQPIGDEADGMVAAIEARWTGIRPLDDPPATPTGATGAVARWFHADADGRPMTTGFVLVERDGWWIAARGSSPDEAGAAGVARLTTAIDAIDWSVPGKLSLR